EQYLRNLQRRRKCLVSYEIILAKSFQGLRIFRRNLMCKVKAGLLALALFLWTESGLAQLTPQQLNEALKKTGETSSTVTSVKSAIDRSSFEPVKNSVVTIMIATKFLTYDTIKIMGNKPIYLANVFANSFGVLTVNNDAGWNTCCFPGLIEARVSKITEKKEY